LALVRRAGQAAGNTLPHAGTLCARDGPVASALAIVAAVIVATLACVTTNRLGWAREELAVIGRISADRGPIRTSAYSLGTHLGRLGLVTGLGLQRSRTASPLGAVGGPALLTTGTIIAPVKEAAGANLAVQLTRKERATILWVAAYKGTIGTLLCVFRADLFTRKERAAIVWVTTYKGTIGAFLRVLGTERNGTCTNRRVD
jgi:hypothetical protein